MPNDNKMLSEFMEFIKAQQQASRPNPLQAIGAGMAGFAAPFLGQQWQNPYAQKQGGGGGMQDLASMMFMQQMMEGRGGQGDEDAPPTKPIPLTGQPLIDYVPEEGSAFKKFLGPSPGSEANLDIWKAGQKGVASSKQGFRKGETEKLSKKFGEAGRVVGAFMNMEGYGKAMDEVEIPNALKQLIQEKQNLVPYLNTETQNKINPVLEFVGQRVETTVGGLPIWSGQTRYVKQLAMEISKTVAQAGLSKKNRQGLTGQSIRNILTLVYATANGQLSAAKLRNMGIDPDSDPVVDERGSLPDALRDAIELTNNQEKQIEEAVDMMRNSPAIRGGKRDKVSKPAQESSVDELLASGEWEVVE